MPAPKVKPPICATFAEKVATSQFYRALADCRWLIAYEAEAMARTPAATRHP